MVGSKTFNIIINILTLIVFSVPGFYQEGEFGIRLENVLEVIEKPWLEHGGQKYLGFKVVTLVPFEINLMKLELMSPQQVCCFLCNL